jgi:hypothetical protein
MPWEGIFPAEIFFIDVTPKKALFCRKPRHLRYQTSKSTGALRGRVVTRSEKLKTGKQETVTSPYWADKNRRPMAMKVGL